MKLLINIALGSLMLIMGAYGLSGSLEKVLSHKTAEIIKKAGTSTYPVFFLSIFLTALVQSSSAITVLAVSLADSGLLSLASSMAVIYGANIGTTVTAQIMSLSIAEYGLYIVVFGIVLRFFRKFEEISKLVMSVGLLFTGIMTLQLSAALINANMLMSGDISLLKCLFFGFLVTALVHSSAATVGLTMTLFGGGLIDIYQAIAIVLGDNIGTCMTAQIAALSSNKTGRVVALGHTLYNILGSVVVLIFMESFVGAVKTVTGFLGQGSEFYIANAHTLYNILSALLILPLNKYFCRFLEAICRN